MFCPKCGTKNRPNARFCKSCGHAFGGGGATESTLLSGASPIEQTFILRSVGPDDPGRTNDSLLSLEQPAAADFTPPPAPRPADNGRHEPSDSFILGEISSPNLHLDAPPPTAEPEAVPDLFRSSDAPQLPPTLVAPLPKPALADDPLAAPPGAPPARPPRPAMTPTPASGVPLPPEVAATPFRPIEPPIGAPRPMGRGHTAELPAATPKPPADLFAQSAPVAGPGRSKFSLGLVIGLSVAAITLAIGAVVVILYLQYGAPAAAPASDTPVAAEPSPQPAIPENMVAIPGGEYVIGRDAGDFFDPYEKPQHAVTLRPFYIDKTEVTNADYQKFVEATGHPAPASWTGGRFEAGKGLFPVTGVTLADAQAYAKWAGKRLPTEAEWEAAAHGRSPTVFPWGDSFDPSRANVKASGLGAPVRVGTYPAGASPFGVLDLTGNVWEWTASEATLYPGSAEKPPSWDKPLEPGAKLQIIRGGAFTEDTKKCTVTYRNWVPSNFSARELGFRCAKDQPPQ
ncbi:MAG: hypothetical protein CFK52_05655 [Chloracidobacterium sp. CP2_5A]|nr:MAG: hypothetical protein CFK52_05655 [Chloracidobacterium sp. CP2_5A]